MKKNKLLYFAILVITNCFLPNCSLGQYTKLFDFDSINGSNPYNDLVSDGTFLYGTCYTGGTHNEGTIFKIRQDGSDYFKLLDFDFDNGYTPSGSLIFDGTFLYGTANKLIFKIKTDSTGYSKLIEFTGVNGAKAMGSLISDGTFLYGMTSAGGLNDSGTVFKIKPDGTGYSKLIDCMSSK